MLQNHVFSTFFFFMNQIILTLTEVTKIPRDCVGRALFLLLKLKGCYRAAPLRNLIKIKVIIYFGLCQTNHKNQKI